jgi:beta-galactosidase/beta-glucuronidase
MPNARVLWAFAAAGLVGLACRGAAGADASLPADVKAVWDMGKAYRQTTPTGERICINGLWRWQPASPDATAAAADNWGFFKVPGPWPGITSYIQADTQTCYPHPTWRGVRLGEVTSAWYQREITIPASWKGRRITVYTEYLNSYAAVYLDGTKAGDIYFPYGQVDITPLVVPGQTQRLSLYVKAVPLAAVVKAFTDTNAPKDVKGQVERRGLCGDVWLESTPNGPRVDDLRVDTSVRKWSITFNVTLADLKPNAQYSLRAQVTDGGKPVETFVSPTFTAADLKEGVFSFERPWHPTSSGTPSPRRICMTCRSHSRPPPKSSTSSGPCDSAFGSSGPKAATSTSTAPASTAR